MASITLAILYVSSITAMNFDGARKGSPIKSYIFSGILVCYYPMSMPI